MRPDYSSLHPIYQDYVALVKQDDVIEALSDHRASLEFYRQIPESKEQYRYAEEKWTPKEIIAHLVDAERYNNTLALSLTGLEWKGLKKDYWFFNTAGERSKSSLIDELAEERAQSAGIFRQFDERHWGLTGESFGRPFNLLGLGFMSVGHELHHIQVIGERYLVG